MLDRNIEELATLAQQFPAESTWFTDAEKKLSDEESEVVVTSSNQKGKAAVVAAGVAAVSDKADDVTKDSSLQNIEDFVKNAGSSDVSSSQPAAPTAQEQAQLSAVQATYSSLLEHVRSEIRSIQDKKSWCKTVLKSASIDRAALKRSLNQVDAKRHLQDGAIADCEQSSKYSVSQHQIIQQQLEQLRVDSEDADRQRQQVLQTVKARSSQLLQATQGLDQDATKLFAGLMSSMSEQKVALYRQESVVPKLRKTVEDADHTVLRLLADSARSNSLRLLQLRSEARLLDSLFKTRARALGASSGATSGAGEDVDAATAAAAEFCSEEGFPEQQKVETLQEEERAIAAAQAAAGRND